MSGRPPRYSADQDLVLEPLKRHVLYRYLSELMTELRNEPRYPHATSTRFAGIERDAAVTAETDQLIPPSNQFTVRVTGSDDSAGEANG